ncbi:MAG: Rha family transcriptional regulator [Bacilli bacterium]
MNLVEVKNGQSVTSSLQVAEVFEKNHQHVLRDINSLKEGVQNWTDLFIEETYIHPQNKQKYPQIIMSKDGFALIAMGFTGKKALEFKLKYIQAFNNMEEQIKQRTLPKTSRELAKLSLESIEEAHQRIDAIESEVSNIKENSLITTEDKNSIDRMIKRKIYAICNDYKYDQQAKKLLFADIGSSIKQLFNVPHRGKIRVKDFQAVVDFISTWKPAATTKAQIKMLHLFK